MNIKQEIQQLKDEEQGKVNPKLSKKERQRVEINFELWPLIPVLICLSLISTLSNSGLTINIWSYWWLIFLVKPFLAGWRKFSRPQSGKCI